MQPSNQVDHEGFLTNCEQELFASQLPAATSDFDVEKKLNEVIELQDRMAKGQMMVDEVQSQLDYIKDGHYVTKDVWNAHITRIKKLKAHWWTLQRECKAIVGPNSHVWAKYFQLVNWEHTPYSIQRSDDASEDIEKPDSRMSPTIDIYADTYQEEMAVYDAPFNENPFLPRSSWDYSEQLKTERQYSPENMALLEAVESGEMF